MTKPHLHDFKHRTETITLSEGKAKDTLKQWVCECGKIITYDLIRL